MPVLLDWNNADFQRDLLALDKDEAMQVLKAFFTTIVPLPLRFSYSIFVKNAFLLPLAPLGSIELALLNTSANCFKTLKKIMQMDWSQIYQDKALRWEYISQQNAYSFRASLKIRILAEREGEKLRLSSIHPDHDSAYE